MTVTSPPVGSSTVSIFRWPVVALALLTLTAGYTDGYSLSRFDVFIANQSGNIVRAGMGVFGEYPQWHLALLSMAGFAVGASGSWLLGIAAPRFGWTLVRARLLAASALLGVWWVTVLLVGNNDEKGIACSILGGMALGVLATVMTRIADTPIQPTFQTATVLNGMRGLVEWATRHDSERSAGRRLALLGVLTVGCYAIGGAMGAFAMRIGPTAVLLGLLLPTLALTLTRADPTTRS